MSWKITSSPRWRRRCRLGSWLCKNPAFTISAGRSQSVEPQGFVTIHGRALAPGIHVSEIDLGIGNARIGFPLQQLEGKFAVASVVGLDSAPGRLGRIVRPGRVK
jgi:hypothetical protein